MQRQKAECDSRMSRDGPTANRPLVRHYKPSKVSTKKDDPISSRFWFGEVSFEQSLALFDDPTGALCGGLRGLHGFHVQECRTDFDYEFKFVNTLEALESFSSIVRHGCTFS